MKRKERLKQSILRTEIQAERIDNRTFEVDSFLENNAEFFTCAEELVAHQKKVIKRQ